MNANASDMFSLAGKTTVVTGAAGILGQNFCRALAGQGSNVALIDLEAPEELAASIASEFGIAARAYNCDLRAPETFAGLISSIESDLGSISILHNNAATKGPDLDRFFDTDEEFEPEIWREIMSVNLDSMFFMARAIAPSMERSGGGSIIQMGSVYGLVGPDQRIYEGSLYLDRQIRSPAVYSASKAGVVGLTRHLAALWGHKGIRVNCLVPGGVDSGQNEVFRDNYSSRVPLGRMAEADDLLGALIYFASDASRYVTGQVLAVDGGLTSW